MAYGTKYVFRFDSDSGANYMIYLQQNGYSGPPVFRNLGRSPVLKKKNSGQIYGTSLEIAAECATDQEFAELYTTDPREFRMVVYRNSAVWWSGFVSPELYSEPDIAPPYDVQIIATDGLGELKQYTFDAQGGTTLSGLFTHLLSFTGNNASLELISSLSGVTDHASPITVSPYLLWTDGLINIDYMAGKSCYDVLQYLLKTLHACLTFHGNQWLVYRENDLVVSSGRIPLADGTSLANAVRTIGPMGTVDSSNSEKLWPVGNLTSRVEPAKKKVIVEAPNHRWSKLVNPDMIKDAGWNKVNSVSYSPTDRAYRFGSSGYLWQVLTGFDASAGFDLSTVMGNVPEGTVGDVTIIFHPPIQSGEGSFYLGYNASGEIGWYTNAEAERTSVSINAGGIGAAIETNIAVPAFAVPGYSTTGRLEVQLRMPALGLVYNFFIYKPISKGYKDIINIDNDARGEGDTVEIAHGRIVSGMTDSYFGYLRGTLIFNSHFITSFSDGNFSGLDFLSIIARNYARSVALPRLKVLGKLNVPIDLSAIPLVLVKDDANYLLSTYTWDLINDEIDVEAISLPLGTLTVDTEDVLDTTGEAPSAQGGGGSTPGSTPGGTTVSWGTESDGWCDLTVGAVTKNVALRAHSHALADMDEDTDHQTVTQEQKTAWSDKQDALTFDNTPTAGSNNPVKSGGIRAALDDKQDKLDFDTVPTAGSDAVMTSGSIYNALQGLRTSPSLAAPSLQIHRQLRVSPSDVAEPHFFLRHPLIAFDNEIRVVLMRWHPRRSRAAANAYTTYRTGWGEAQSGVRNAVTPTWYNSLGTGSEILAIPLYSVRQWILNHYICGFAETEQQMREMTLAIFRGLTNSSFRFGAKFAPQKTGWTVADWAAHTKSSWLFGFAVRVPNPAFTAAVDPEHSTGLVDSTRQIEDPDHPGHYIQRYIYSATVPFRAFCLQGQDGPLVLPGPATLKWDIGFRLEYGPR